jgi:4-azaleucine resistance transporter AzlC
VQPDALTPASRPEALSAPTTRRRQVTAGVRDSFSAGLGIFPLGIALGLMILQAGLPWWLTPALSLSAFAGSLELLLVGMTATVTPLAAVALTVLVVNFRHVFYAFSLPLHLVKHPAAKAYAVCAMIDEAYAVNAALSEHERSAPRLLAMQAACEIYWVGGGLVGVALGSALPAPIRGLEFALCALFTVLTLDAFRSRREIPSFLLAGASVTVALVLTPGLAMFTALLLFVGLLLARHALAARRSAEESVDAQYVVPDRRPGDRLHDHPRPARPSVRRPRQTARLGTRAAVVHVDAGGHPRDPRYDCPPRHDRHRPARRVVRAPRGRRHHRRAPGVRPPHHAVRRSRYHGLPLILASAPAFRPDGEGHLKMGVTRAEAWVSTVHLSPRGVSGLDVLLYDGQGRPAAASGEVGTGPEVSAP